MQKPAMSMREAVGILCAPGAPFETVPVEVNGIPMKGWKNQPPTLAALARLARAGFGGNEFLVHEDERVTYEGWFRATAAFARVLRQAGVAKGDRVAIAMRNMPEWPVAFFAAAAVGAIVVPLNAWWQGSELLYALRDSGTSALIADEARYKVLEPLLGELPAIRHIWVTRTTGPLSSPVARPMESAIGAVKDYGALPDADLPDVKIEPDDDATIFYTSGTTGNPKGALGTHRNALTASLGGAFSAQRAKLIGGETLQPSQPRVGLLVIPLFHVTACNASMLSTMLTGSKTVMMRKWDAVEAMRLIEREKVNLTGGVPTIAWQLIEHPERGRFDLSSLEAISYGGAPAAPELVRRIDSDLKSVPGSGWGMTETSATVTHHSAIEYLTRPDSAGPPIAVSELKIMAPDGVTELPVGAVGELWAFGPQIVKGYWGNPEATAATFRGGWVRTGDIAKLDAEGYLYIVDRAKDIIIRGGENIYSIEVENILYDHPAVTDAALVGIPHRTLGEVPGAVVHLAPGETAGEEELKAFVRERLAGFKVPERVLFSAEPLPRNANGKIVKAELRAMFA